MDLWIVNIIFTKSSIELWFLTWNTIAVEIWYWKSLLQNKTNKFNSQFIWFNKNHKKYFYKCFLPGKTLLYYKIFEISIDLCCTNENQNINESSTWLDSISINLLYFLNNEVDAWCYCLNKKCCSCGGCALILTQYITAIIYILEQTTFGFSSNSNKTWL